MFKDRRFVPHPPSLWDLLKEIEKLKNEKEYYLQVIASYQEEINTWKKKLNQLENWTRGTYMTIKNQQQVINNQNRKIEELKKIIENKNKEISNLKNKIRLLSTQIANPPSFAFSAPLSFDFLKDGKWIEVLPHPSIIIIIGKKGSGKSACGYRLLELFKWKLNVYVYKFPLEEKDLLPSWIGIANNLDSILPNSIILVDESYLFFHSRKSQKKENLEINKAINLSRHRNQTFIFVCQEGRQLDKNILSGADTFIIRELEEMQLKFERPEISDVLKKAKEKFKELDPPMRKRFAYLYCPSSGFSDLIEILLPSFWSEKLSTVYFNVKETISEDIYPIPIPKKEKIKKAKELRKAGYSYGEISKFLGISKSTAYRYTIDDKN